MITVKRLKEELSKFPDDAICYAYEGEVRGVVISSKEEKWGGDLGYIACGEDEEEEKITEIRCPIKS